MNVLKEELNKFKDITPEKIDKAIDRLIARRAVAVEAANMYRDKALELLFQDESTFLEITIGRLIEGWQSSLDKADRYDNLIWRLRGMKKELEK